MTKPSRRPRSAALIEQALAASGSLLILVAYAANQLSRLGPNDSTYGLLNVVGAGLLAVAAVMTAVWGFVALEGTWAVVSLVALLRLSRRSTRRTPAEKVDVSTGAGRGHEESQSAGKG